MTIPPLNSHILGPDAATNPESENLSPSLSITSPLAVWDAGAALTLEDSLLIAIAGGGRAVRTPAGLPDV